MNFLTTGRFIDDHQGSVRDDPFLMAALKYLTHVTLDFSSGVFEHKVSGIPLKRQPFETSDYASAWSSFKQELGYRLASLTKTDLTGELGINFVISFLEDFKRIRHVEVSPDVVDIRHQ